MGSQVPYMSRSVDPLPEAQLTVRCVRLESNPNCSRCHVSLLMTRMPAGKGDCLSVLILRAVWCLVYRLTWSALRGLAHLTFDCLRSVVSAALNVLQK